MARQTVSKDSYIRIAFTPEFFITFFVGLGWAFISFIVAGIGSSTLSPVYMPLSYPSLIVGKVFFTEEFLKALQELTNSFTRSGSMSGVMAISIGFFLLYIMLTSFITIPITFLIVNVYKVVVKRRSSIKK